MAVDFKVMEDDIGALPPTKLHRNKRYRYPDQLQTAIFPDSQTFLNPFGK
jgi:hypothetical protein